jgi:hypothetical protein
MARAFTYASLLPAQIRYRRTKRVTLRIWQPLIIPGLLQTAEYAHALFAGERSGLAQDTLRRFVDARLECQQIFDRDDPPHTSILLDEPVPRRLIGTPQIMHDQLLQVADLSMRPCIRSR